MTPVATPPQTLQGAAAQVGKCGAAGTASNAALPTLRAAKVPATHFRIRMRHGAAFAPGSGPEVPAPRHFRGRQFECMYTAAQSSWSLRIIPRILGSNDDHGQQMLTLESPSGRGALFGAFCAGP